MYKPSVVFLTFLFIIQTIFIVNPYDIFAGHMGQDLHGETEEEEEEEKDKCDEEAEETQCCPNDGSPVYLYNGEHYYTLKDIELSGPIPIEIRRHYSSFSLYNAEFGYGWIMNYDYKLYRQSDGNLLLRRGCYDRDEFTDNGDGTFSGPTDSFETITENSDGTYTLNRQNNWEYQFDINGSLSSIDDENGNQLVFTYSSEKMPVNGISPYSSLSTSIVIAYMYQLQRIEQYVGGVASGRYIQFTYNDDGRIVTAADSFGREVYYTYDTSGNGDLVTFTDAEGNSYNYTYENHLLTQHDDAGCGDCGTYYTEYDSNNRASSQTHGTLVLEFDYIEEGVQTQVTRSVYNDSTGTLLRQYTKTYYFDSNKNLTQETTTYGSTTITWQYTYNSQDLITQKIDPLGNTTDYTYASNGNLLTETTTLIDGSTLTKTYTYDSNDNKTSEEISASWDSQTYRTEYSYDSNGNLAGESRILDSSITYTTTYTYTSQGWIDTITYPEGNEISYEYNSYGLVTREYDPNNESHQTQYTYDSWGNRASITDANGNTTTYTYDNLNRLTGITNPEGEQTIYTWTGKVITQIEEGRTETESGHITKITYDDLNRKTAVTKETSDGDITIASYTYDSEGNVLSITDANGNTTDYSYDTIGRLATVTDPLGNSTTYSYDDINNLTSTTDAEGNTTTYQYNGLSWLTTVTQADVSVTTYTYNAIGNVLTITDAESHTTTNTYDRLGRLSAISDPLSASTSYTYDGNDNLASKTDANGNTTTYSYNDYNQLTTITYPSGTVSFTYDNVGNLLTYSDGTTSATYGYDALNRLTSITTTYSFGSKVISYTYDRFGNKETSTYPDTDEVTYTYDDLSRLSTINHQLSTVVTYAYDDASRLTTKTLANSTATTYSYDSTNRLTSITNPNISYTHDNIGNRLTRTDSDGDHSYTYNDVYRLTSTDHPDPLTDESYSYDNVGNRQTNADHTDWTYNASNQLTSYDSVTYTYDNNGNTTTKTDADGTTTYTWDYENRLTNILTPSSVLRFSYDPFGKRLSKTVDGTTIYYLYDNEDIIAEYDSTGTLLRSYIHGPGIDEPIRMTDNATSTNYYYLADGLGSITEIQDSTGTTVEKYRYDSFGNPTIMDNAGTELTESAISNPYMFTAREWDTETQIYYYRARYYDAGAGRFLSEDPIKFWGGINFYVYVNNNPINYIDPFGYTGITPPTPPINQAQIQAQIDSIRSQIAELEAKLKDPCLSTAEKGSIIRWLRYLRALIEFLIRLLSQEPPPPPPGGPPEEPDTEITVVVDPNSNTPDIYGPYW